MGRARWQVIRQYLPFPIFSPAHSSAYHSLSYYIFESLFVLSTLFYLVYPFPFFLSVFFLFFFDCFDGWPSHFGTLETPLCSMGNDADAGPHLEHIFPYIAAYLIVYRREYLLISYWFLCGVLLSWMPGHHSHFGYFLKKSETIDHFVYSETEKEKNGTKEEEEDETKDVVMNRENKNPSQVTWRW